MTIQERFHTEAPHLDLEYVKATMPEMLKIAQEYDKLRRIARSHEDIDRLAEMRTKLSDFDHMRKERDSIVNEMIDPPEQAYRQARGAAPLPRGVTPESNNTLIDAIHAALDAGKTADEIKAEVNDLLEPYP